MPAEGGGLGDWAGNKPAKRQWRWKWKNNFIAKWNVESRLTLKERKRRRGPKDSRIPLAPVCCYCLVGDFVEQANKLKKVTEVGQYKKNQSDSCQSWRLPSPLSSSLAMIECPGYTHKKTNKLRRMTWIGVYMSILLLFDSELGRLELQTQHRSSRRM